MPNHVRQRLTVAGHPADVAAFVATARGARPLTGDRKPQIGRPPEPERLHVEPLCFHMIAPLDDDYSKYPYGTVGGGRTGYELEAEGWGVKWGPYEYANDPGEDEEHPGPEVTEDGHLATYEFTCAWEPPCGALRRASLRYRVLEFFLSYGGEGPCRGRYTFRDGEQEGKNDDWKSEMKSEWDAVDRKYPEDDDEKVDGNEDRRCGEHDALERKHIDAHDEWVSTSWRASAAAHVLKEKTG